MTGPPIRRAEPYEVTTISTRAELRSLAEPWGRFLETAPAGCSLFNDLEYVERMLSDVPDARLHGIVLWHDHQMVAVAVFAAYRRAVNLELLRGRAIGFPARVLRLLGEQVLLSPAADAQQCLRAIFRSLFSDGPPFDALQLPMVDMSGPVWRFLRSPDSPGAGYRTINPLIGNSRMNRIEFDGTFDAYGASLGGSTRSTVKRRWRTLQRKLPGARLVRVTDADQVHAFLLARDQVRRDTRRARREGFRPHQPQRRETLEWVARKGWLRSYLLVCDEQPLAYKLGYQYRNRYEAFETGYAEAHAKHSPGMVLEWLRIEDLFSHDPPEWMDLGMGTQQYKASLCNRHTEACTLWITRDAGRQYYTLKAQYAWNHVYGALRRARNAARGSLHGLLRTD